MFFKVGVLKKFVNFTGKCLCWNIFLIKLKESCEICKVFKKICFEDYQRTAASALEKVEKNWYMYMKRTKKFRTSHFMLVVILLQLCVYMCVYVHSPLRLHLSG